MTSCLPKRLKRDLVSRRFKALVGDGDWTARELHVVQNWFETLQRRTAGIP